MKKEQGITLISLVITIIVLLILAGVTISEITNQNGLKQKIEEKEQEYNDIMDSEQIEIEELANSVYKNLGDVPENAVAKMDSKYYTTLQSAIDVVPADNTKKVIFLLKDVQEDINIAENKKIVFYLENHTLAQKDTTKNTVNNFGNITMIGGTVFAEDLTTIYNHTKGTVNIKSGEIKSKSKMPIYNSKDATTIISGGNIQSEQDNAISNYGTLEISKNANINSNQTENYPTVVNQNAATLTITDGTIKSKTSNAVWNKTGGRATITGGNLQSETNSILYNEGTLDLNQGLQITATATEPAIKNKQKLTIDGVTITASNSIGIQNTQAGNITIKNVTISSSGNTLNNEGTINIANANLTSTADQCIENKANSTLTINGGTYRAVATEKRTILNIGTLTITAGNFTSDKDRPLWNEGTGDISGGTFTGNNEWSVIANSGGKLTITGGTNNVINKVNTRKFANVNNGVLIIDGVTQPQGTIY